jgi:hypothetical protein
MAEDMVMRKMLAEAVPCNVAEVALVERAL